MQEAGGGTAQANKEHFALDERVWIEDNHTHRRCTHRNPKSKIENRMNDDVTPIRKQYLDIKRQYPDTLVLFRLGDFYETFDADAELMARELDIVLTSRPVGKGQRVPLAGVPHHAVEAYVARLIEKGYRVAIAEQMADPATVKGIVPREVIRVVTPGTVIEPALLDDKRPNYLAAWVEDDGRVGLAHADVTTGEFAVTQFAADALDAARNELVRLNPRECLVLDTLAAGQLAAPHTHMTPLAAWKFEYGNARQALLDHFSVGTLAGFGLEGLTLAIRAAGAIIQYLRETQMQGLAQITGLTSYTTSVFMTLDAATRRNLEITETIRGKLPQGSLLGVLDATRTPMGARLLRVWLSQPLLDRARIEMRLERVAALAQDTLARESAAAALKAMPDLERQTTRVVAGNATPRDLLAIRRALEAVPDVRRAVESARRGEEALSLSALLSELDPCQDVAALVAQAINDDAPAALSSGGVIRAGYSAELDGILIAARDAKTWVANLEKAERERTGIRTLKVGYNKVFGYYLEVTHAQAEHVPNDYIRKQTLVNAERYITPQLKEYEALILNAEERLLEVEKRLFIEICQQVAARANALLKTAKALAQIDVAVALAQVAIRNRFVRPTLVDADELHIVGGRHPVVEQTLSDVAFVPNDLHFDANERVLVITGPNMSGKSTFLRQAALIVLMAQIGSFVPAEAATLGIVDRIFTRIGAQDEIAAGQSTFMVEMVETANILHHATSRSLIVLDEIGRGTSTYDGLSIAWAVIEYLHNHPRLRAKTLFATHYHELVELAASLPQVRNYNVAVAEEGDRVVFLHKIVPGGADRSYGIHVAQLAGLPKPVIRRAQELLRDLESGARAASAAQAPKARQPESPQLSFFVERDPVLDALKAMDVNSLSPLEALMKLYELQKLAKPGA
jgi:DNA mismatch repair protein MutS